MPAKKIKDAAVVVREYQDRNGQAKKQWATVGSLIQFDDGGTVLMLDKSFNPAGVPGDSCRISFFDPKAPGASAPVKEVSEDLPF